MSTLFGRKTEVIIGDRILQNPPLSIEFELPFNDDEKENTGNITLYNLSKATIDNFKKGASVILKSGYKDSFGTIGVFTVKEAYSRLDNVDKAFIVTVGEESTEWKNLLINKTWKAGIKASEVISDIIKSLGLTIAELNLAVDLQYPRGKNFLKSAKLCLQELVSDCKSTMRYSRGTIYINPPGGGKVTGFVLNSKSGLVGVPEKMVDSKGNVRYKIVSLMNYQIEIGTYIKIESSDLNGQFKVKKATYSSNESDHVVIMEVA